MVSSLTGHLLYKEAAMGGIASGRRPAANKRRPVVEDRIVLDLKNFKKHLIPDALIAQAHSKNGTEVFRMVIAVSEDSLTLHYKLQKQIQKEKIFLNFAPCNYGGSRAYMLCPECDKQYRILYLGNKGRWACRKCLGLAYKIQRLTKRKRHFHMVEKIKNRRFKDGPVSQKPSRMWAKTHADLVNRIAQHHQEGFESFREWFDNIHKKYGP